MDAEIQQTEQPPTETDGGPSFIEGLLASPFLWGAAVTAGFYQLIPHLPMYSGLVERYFCGHPLEYVLAGLFFVGMAILVRKALGVRTEHSTLDIGHRLVGKMSVAEDEDPAESADALEHRIRETPGSSRRSVLVTRIRDACDHVRSRRSVKGLSEHLKYLAELAAERSYESFALVRTVTWAVPIIGFLGTVIGITLAISNLTPEQLDKSLNAVTSGLGVAFDTTALALAMSVVMVFTSFLVERSEQRVLTRVEDFGMKRLAALFPAEVESRSPLAEAEAHAAHQLIAKTDSLIERQTEMWQTALESTREKWVAALENQKVDFDSALQDGMRATLADHAEQLNSVRDVFLEAFQEAAGELRTGIADSHSAHSEMQTEFRERMDESWKSVRADLGELQEEQRNGVDRLMRAVTERVSEWQAQLHETTEAGTEQLGELRRQREVLLKVAEQEETLVRLQSSLNENLDLLQAAETFEETMHSLSAAVHLLTTKTRTKAA